MYHLRASLTSITVLQSCSYFVCGVVGVGSPGRWMRVIHRGLGRYREMLGDVVGKGGWELVGGVGGT